MALSAEADPQVLLTVRAGSLPTHAGQIAFPGGSLEAGETAVQAALREAEEEVGLPGTEVKVLGELDDVWTPAGFHVTPVLARITSQSLQTLQLSSEVTQVLTPRVSELYGVPLTYESKRDLNGDPMPMYRFPWQGHDIWGMTARVLYDLLFEDDKPRKGALWDT